MIRARWSLAVLCIATVTAASPEKVRYLPIGDSYTIGEGASPNESWPAVLARHLSDEGFSTELLANPAVTGWTTQQAIDNELPVFRQLRPNLATLLIGVNDWVQGVDENTFRQRFRFLVDEMLKVLGDKRRLIVVTIPDFGVTPTGKQYARGRNISEGIAAFNQVISEESAERGLRVIDIFPLSKKMGEDSSLVAKDGLHPSPKEYVEWEKLIFPAALESVTRR